jgi:hypothetical protein
VGAWLAWPEAALARCSFWRRGALAVAVEVKGEGRGIGMCCEVGRESGLRALNGLLSWRWFRHCEAAPQQMVKGS